MQTPPPSITPRQMNLLRVITAMAWADGDLAVEEVDLMLARLSEVFASDSQQQQELQQELRDYLHQNIPLAELIPQLESIEERQLVLRLGYEVIQANRRAANEPAINPAEAAAYQKLKQSLALPADIVRQIESESDSEVYPERSAIDSLVGKLKHFMA